MKGPDYFHPGRRWAPKPVAKWLRIRAASRHGIEKLTFYVAFGWSVAARQHAVGLCCAAEGVSCRCLRIYTIPKETHIFKKASKIAALYKRTFFLILETKFTVTEGRGEQRTDEERGTEISTLLRVKQTCNKDLPQSAGNCSH